MWGVLRIAITGSRYVTSTSVVLVAALVGPRCFWISTFFKARTALVSPYWVAQVLRSGENDQSISRVQLNKRSLCDSQSPRWQRLNRSRKLLYTQDNKHPHRWLYRVLSQQMRRYYWYKSQ